MTIATMAVLQSGLIPDASAGVIVVGAVALAVVGTPLWFAVAGLGAVGLVFWARQRTQS